MMVKRESSSTIVRRSCIAEKWAETPSLDLITLLSGDALNFDGVGNVAFMLMFRFGYNGRIIFPVVRYIRTAQAQYIAEIATGATASIKETCSALSMNLSMSRP